MYNRVVKPFTYIDIDEIRINVDENTFIHSKQCKFIYNRAIFSLYYIAIECFHPLK